MGRVGLTDRVLVVIVHVRDDTLLRGIIVGRGSVGHLERRGRPKFAS